jgi:hypothetical protein
MGKGLKLDVVVVSTRGKIDGLGQKIVGWHNKVNNISCV